MLTFVNEMSRDLLVKVLDDEILANVVGPDSTPDDLYAQYAIPNPFRYFILSDGLLAGELTFRASSAYVCDVGF